MSAPEEGRATEIRHLYIHVPFCPTLCPFCNFHVLQRREDLVDAYLTQLDRDAAGLADRLELNLDTIYVGGGTPTHLRDGELERLVAVIADRLGGPAPETTIEVHPSTMWKGRSSQLVDLGFTRLSVGLQSTQDVALRYLHRPHDARTAIAAVHDAVDAAHGSVSADVISAVPGQDLAADLEAVADLGVDHLSVYTLTIEAGTPFARSGESVDPDVAAAALGTTAAVLDERGFARYEVSNHARPGAWCRHNQAYWDGAWWAALGPSGTGNEPPSASHDGADVRAWSVVNATMNRWLQGAPPRRTAQSSADVFSAGILTGLRLAGGIDLAALVARSGTDLPPDFERKVAAAVDRGWLRDDANPFASPSANPSANLVTTDAGLLILDRVVGSLL